MHILQFEYEDISGLRAFLKVHNTFKHHYTGETMRCVQIDYIFDDEADSFFCIMNQAEFEAYYSRRIEENSET